MRGLAPGVSLDGQLQLDQLISAFIKLAREKGFTLAEIRSRVKGWLDFQPPERFLVIERDPELRKILLAEISESTKFPVHGVDPEACKDPAVLAGSVLVALYGRAEELNGLLPDDVSCITLQSRSALELDKLSIDECSRQGVAVISRWPDFLRWARAVLLARGTEAARLSFRDAREKHWQKGLRSCVVLTDAVTAAQLPSGCRTLLLKVIAESSLQELRQFVDQFLGSNKLVSLKNKVSRSVRRGLKHGRDNS